MKTPAIPFREQLAIFAHEVRCVWLVACDLKDQPKAVTDKHIQRLAQSIQRVDALRGAA